MTDLRKVESFLKQTAMFPATFGRKVAGDPGLVFQMRKGREIRPKMRQRIERFISESLEG